MSYSTLKLFPACNIKVDYEEENRKSFYLSKMALVKGDGWFNPHNLLHIS